MLLGSRLCGYLRARSRRRHGARTGSVYNAFGDKRALFTAVLRRYLDANMRARIARVEKTLPPRWRSRPFSPRLLTLAGEPPRLPSGNAALEVAPHDPDIAAIGAARMGELEAFFRRTMSQVSVTAAYRLTGCKG